MDRFQRLPITIFIVKASIMLLKKIIKTSFSILEILDFVKIDDLNFSGPKWRVLVVDKFSMRMISTCIKMHELVDKRITRK